MKRVGHSVPKHVAVDYVAAGGVFPLPDLEGRNLLRDVLQNLIRDGVVEGTSVSGAELALTERGATLRARWCSPEFRAYCHCSAD